MFILYFNYIFSFCIRILDLVTYVMQLHECTNIYLLCSGVANLFFVQ